jgi:hypothetical protein
MKEEAMEGLKAEAAKMGITPNILARLIMHERFSPPDTESKSYILTVKDWQDVEAYVEAKRLGSVEGFGGFAMEQYMTKYPLTEGQKRHIKGKLGNTDIPPLGCTA